MVCLKKTLSCVTSCQLRPHPWSFADPELHLPLFLPGFVDQILFIKALVSSHVSDHIFTMAQEESDLAEGSISWYCGLVKICVPEKQFLVGAWGEVR